MVRMMDIRKRVTMNETVFTAIMMIKTSAMINNHRTTRDDPVELFITPTMNP